MYSPQLERMLQVAELYDRAQVADHFNAEVVAGTIGSKQDAIDYLTWTFFFRRVLQNPSYYDLEDTEMESVSAFLSNMVERNMALLQAGSAAPPAASAAPPRAATATSGPCTALSNTFHCLPEPQGRRLSKCCLCRGGWDGAVDALKMSLALQERTCAQSARQRPCARPFCCSG